MKNSFGRLFKQFRMRASMYRLADVAEAFAAEGIMLEESLFSHWQKNKRLPKDRNLVRVLINIFVRRGGIESLTEANHFMEAAGFGYLTLSEEKALMIVRGKQMVFHRGLVYFARTKEELKRILQSLKTGKTVSIVFCFSCRTHGRCPTDNLTISGV